MSSKSQRNDKNKKHVVIIKAQYYMQLNNMKISLEIISILMMLLIFCQNHSVSIVASAHFIQIDQNEFRAGGYPRPLPPPLPPLEQHLPQHLPSKELTPAEFMVDLTNDLTYRILHYHSILNRNNFAFSPTALMSVLIALFEGSDGRSATELKNVLQLPNNKDVIRVGYRDIHRRLRTYFFGSDNPLKGLSLNRDNVTITRDYETILMFYGYDLGIDMVSSAATMPTDNTTETITTPMTMSTENAETTEKSETETTEAVTKGTEEASEMTITTSGTTPTTATDTPITTTTEKPTETIEETTTETTSVEKTSTEATETTETTTVVPASTGEDAESETAAVPPAEGDEAAELVSTFVAEDVSEPLSRIQKARVTRLPSGKLQAPPVPSVPKLKNAAITLPRNNYLPSIRSGNAAITSSVTPTGFNSRRRPKRHLFNNFKDVDASLFVALFQPPQPQPAHHNLFSVSGPSSPIGLTHFANEYEIEVAEPDFLTALGPGGGGGIGVGAGLSVAETKQNYNTDIISHIFYLINNQIIYTTYKVYKAVLYYKYFENLKMNVLELELDTPEYNLMILLPDYHTDLVAAAASLRLAPTLRLMRKQLKPKWVQAIIPDFKLHGTMFLTNDLQNLGICELFEPNRAVFRPMTEEKGIYVKHIEQQINVAIKTHPINQLKRFNAAQIHPIQISVNHPFLFFIIDRDLDIAVMSGRILNPLNVRIQ